MLTHTALWIFSFFYLNPPEKVKMTLVNLQLRNQHHRRLPPCHARRLSSLGSRDKTLNIHCFLTHVGGHQKPERKSYLYMYSR